MGGYRRLHSSLHILIRLIKEWKTQLDKNKIVGSVLLDFSKAFDCIPQDLLIAKLDAFGFDKQALSFIYSYLKNKKLSVGINNVYRTFLDLISGVPQGSVLEALLFYIFLIDLTLFHNYADNNTFSAYSSDLNSVINIFVSESQTTINRLEANHLIVNPKIFKAKLVSKRKNTTPEDLT